MRKSGNRGDTKRKKESGLRFMEILIEESRRCKQKDKVGKTKEDREINKVYNEC